MAKLSDRQKNNILAKWNTGVYTKTQLAKTYKVNEKTIRDIVGKKEPENSHIVEAQTAFEISKNSEKTPIEVKAINQAVKYNLDSIEYKNKNIENIHEITNDILSGVKDLIRGKKAHKVMTESMGEAGSSAVPIEYPLQAEHYEKAMNTVDKASITLKVNERHASAIKIDNTNAQQTVNEVKIIDA